MGNQEACGPSLVSGEVLEVATAIKLTESGLLEDMTILGGPFVFPQIPRIYSGCGCFFARK